MNKRMRQASVLLALLMLFCPGRGVAAHQHSWEMEIRAASCTEGGWTQFTCDCGETRRSNETSPLGHDHVYVSTTPPTCTGYGFDTYICKRCGDMRTGNETEPLGHDYAPGAVTAPTCTEGGYTEFVCTRCGDTRLGDETQPLGHDYVTGAVTAPTCTEGGHAELVCTRCGDTRPGDETQQLGHDYVSGEVTAPTCTEDGYTEFVCARCGMTRRGDETEALGHFYADGYCVVCGAVDPDPATSAVTAEEGGEPAAGEDEGPAAGDDETPAEPEARAADWKDAPVITSVKQTAGGTVSLEWTSAVDAPFWSVYDVTDGYRFLKTVTTRSAVVTGIPLDTRTFRVRARSAASSGAELGALSEPVSLYIVSAWRLAPVITSLEQTAGGTLELTWDAVADARFYSVYEIVNGSRVWKKTVSGKTATLTGVPNDTHTYVVRPRNAESSGAMLGSVSAPASIYVVSGWRLPPVITSAEQDGVGGVTLTWDTAADAQFYSVYELVDGRYVWRMTTAGKTAAMADVSAGEHTYAVRARNAASSSAMLGRLSEPVTLDVENGWRVSPVISSAEAVGEGEIALSWQGPDEAPFFSIYETVNGRYTWRRTVTGKTCTLTGVSSGVHTYTVRARSAESSKAELGLRSEPVTAAMLWPFTADVLEDGTLAITGGSGGEIPASAGGTAVTAIAENAFAGNTALTSAVIPGSVTRVGAGAFSGCTALADVAVPASVVEFGDGWLAGTPSDLLIRTSAGSAAARWARANHVDRQADTQYRALLIGQTYAENPDISTLPGGSNDIHALKEALEGHSGTPWSVVQEEDLSAGGIFSEIQSAYAGADEDDVSLFYYSGHGVSGTGSLLGTDRERISPTQLRSALDAVPGRKIVIVDACYSGNLLTAKSGSNENDAEEFTQAFIAAFSRTGRSNLAGDGYFVITAASGAEQSWAAEFNGEVYSIFTFFLCCGLGSDPLDGPGDLLADDNGNSVVTLQELWRYTYGEALDLTSGWDVPQYAQVWPGDCDWLGVVRGS